MGSTNISQIVLGLLVSKGGYPLAYDIFEGNKFEGHTMLPIIDAFKKNYDLGSLIVVADSGLMSKINVAELQQKGYEYIIGARIKVGSKDLKEQILSLKLKNGESAIINKDDGSKLIVQSQGPVRTVTIENVGLKSWRNR